MGKDETILKTNSGGEVGSVSPADQTGEAPGSLLLAPNYPNPFNHSTLIEYSVPRNEFITLQVFDLWGRLVRTLISASQAAGVYRVRFESGDLVTGINWY